MIILSALVLFLGITLFVTIWNLITIIDKNKKLLEESERYIEELHTRYDTLSQKEFPVETPTEVVSEVKSKNTTDFPAEMNGIQRSIARDSLGLIPTNETYQRH